MLSSCTRKFAYEHHSACPRSRVSQLPQASFQLVAHADARKRATTIARYRTSGQERLESIAQEYVGGGFMNEALLSEDFVAYADGVRFVNDLTREQHLQVLRQIMDGGHEEAEAVHSAISSNGSVFVLVLSHSGKFAAPLISRLHVNDDGKVDKVWRRRGVLRSELEILRDVEGVRERMAKAPAFHVEELVPDVGRQDRMMRVLDGYLETLSQVDNLVRKALVDRITTEDFQKWDGTSVWEPMGGNQVLDREGLVMANGRLAMLGGPETHHNPGSTRMLVHGKAASATHNLGFLHMSFTASSDVGPTALDIMAAFGFTSDGSKLRQVMFFRSAMGLPEYASAFKMASDVSCMKTVPGMEFSG